jgi:hypothetical protein
LGGLIAVVRAAPKLNVLSCGLTTRAVWHNVVVLQEALFAAAAPRAADECALPVVTEPHRALDLGWDVARPGRRGAANTWTICCGCLSLAHYVEQRRQRSSEDLSRIAVWDLVTQQRLRQPEFLNGLSVCRELHSVPLWGERGDCRRASYRVARRLLVFRRIGTHRSHGRLNSEREPADRRWH